MYVGKVLQARRDLKNARVAFAIGVGLVTLYAALLRYEALVANYAWTGQPAWSATLQRYAVPVARVLRPPSIAWGPNPRLYIAGDPINYLRYAREMRHFYQAHVREPVFLELTRVSLWLTGGRDIGLKLRVGDRRDAGRARHAPARRRCRVAPRGVGGRTRPGDRDDGGRVEHRRVARRHVHVLRYADRVGVDPRLPQADDRSRRWLPVSSLRASA